MVLRLNLGNKATVRAFVDDLEVLNCCSIGGGDTNVGGVRGSRTGSEYAIETTVGVSGARDKSFASWSSISESPSPSELKPSSTKAGHPFPERMVPMPIVYTYYSVKGDRGVIENSILGLHYATTSRRNLRLPRVRHKEYRSEP